MNFKVRVKENIGENSRECFGKPGTILEVKDGALYDIDGDGWKSDCGRFISVEEINNEFDLGLSYDTEFELVEEDEEEIKFEDIVDGLGYNLSLNNTDESSFLKTIENNEVLLFLKDYDCINANNIHDFAEWIAKVDKYVHTKKVELENKPKEMTLKDIEKELGYKIRLIK